MQKYKSITRTTLDKTDSLPFGGVYVLAYMGKVVYVGKASDSVMDRLSSHWRNKQFDELGLWMDKIKADWHNVRLDVLEAPDMDNFDYWLRTAEAELVRKFKPLLNEQLQAG